MLQCKGSGNLRTHSLLQYHIGKIFINEHLKRSILVILNKSFLDKLRILQKAAKKGRVWQHGRQVFEI